MLRSDFIFQLPKALIAQYPLSQRSDSRLLHLAPHTFHPQDRQFAQLSELLKPGDLLIMNNTKVIPARLQGKKASGGQIEVLVERILASDRFLALVKSSKSPKSGTRLILGSEKGSVNAEVLGRQGQFFEIAFLDSQVDVLAFLDCEGAIPLPPYVNRPVIDEDLARYQTVYAQHSGAVAAPTAGLHFDQTLIAKLAATGITTGFITLHVGAGTFQPVRVDDLSDHVMHSEYINVDGALCEQIKKAKAAGGRIIAVGTTAVRALEAASQSGKLMPYHGDTDIFIKPGYRFRSVDALITNFHLPESTLLMLVCALGGYDRVMAAYQHAVAQQYRFFSYGDANLIWPYSPE